MEKLINESTTSLPSLSSTQQQQPLPSSPPPTKNRKCCGCRIITTSALSLIVICVLASLKTISHNERDDKHITLPTFPPALLNLPTPDYSVLSKKSDIYKRLQSMYSSNDIHRRRRRRTSSTRQQHHR